MSQLIGPDPTPELYRDPECVVGLLHRPWRSAPGHPAGGDAAGEARKTCRSSSRHRRHHGSARPVSGETSMPRGTRWKQPWPVWMTGSLSESSLLRAERPDRRNLLHSSPSSGSSKEISRGRGGLEADGNAQPCRWLPPRRLQSLLWAVDRGVDSRSKPANLSARRTRRGTQPAGKALRLRRVGHGRLERRRALDGRCWRWPQGKPIRLRWRRMSRP